MDFVIVQDVSVHPEPRQRSVRCAHRRTVREQSQSIPSPSRGVGMVFIASPISSAGPWQAGKELPLPPRSRINVWMISPRIKCTTVSGSVAIAVRVKTTTNVVGQIERNDSAFRLPCR